MISFRSNLSVEDSTKPKGLATVRCNIITKIIVPHPHPKNPTRKQSSISLFAKDTALIFPIKLSILHKSASQRSVSLLNKVDHKSSNRDILHHDSRRLVGFIIKSFLTRRGAGFARDKETRGQGERV